MFKLTIECKNVSELSELVTKLGGKAEQGKVEVSEKKEEPKTSSDLTPKQKLQAECDSMGIKYAQKDTMSDLEEKINQAKTGVKKEVVAEAPAQTPPSMNNNPFPQQEAQAQTPPSMPESKPTFVRQDAINEIVGRLQQCGKAGIPEDQIAPEIVNILSSIGAPTNLRLSEQEDKFIEAAKPKILSMLEQKLRSGQTSSFI